MQTNVGLAYRRMHGILILMLININIGIKEPTHEYQNCFFWWVCQDDRIFMWPTYYLDQYHSKPYCYLGDICLGMKVLQWYMDPNGIKNKNTINYPYPTGVKKMCNPHYRYPNDIKKDKHQTNTTTDTIFHPRVVSKFVRLREEVQGVSLNFQVSLHYKTS